MSQTIAVIRGDGIGPEIMDASLEVLDAMKLGLEYEFVEAGMSALEKTGELLPAATLALAAHGGAFGLLALGGRYDAFGARFGRARAATGFSLDLRLLARLSSPRNLPGAILAPWPEEAVVRAEIERLRANGEAVVAALPGHEGSWREAGCDRQLVCRDGQWIIEPLLENQRKN